MKSKYLSPANYLYALQSLRDKLCARPTALPACLRAALRCRKGHYSYTVIVLRRHTQESAEAMAASLQAQRLDFRNHIHLLCVDTTAGQAPQEQTESLAEEAPGNIRILPLPGADVQAARLHALRHAESDYVLFAEPGDVFDYHALYRADRALGKHPRAGITALNRMTSGKGCRMQDCFSCTAQRHAGDALLLHMEGLVLQRQRALEALSAVPASVSPRAASLLFAAHYQRLSGHAQPLLLRHARCYTAQSLTPPLEKPELFLDDLRQAYLPLLQDEQDHEVHAAFLRLLTSQLQWLLDEPARMEHLPAEKQQELLNAMEEVCRHLPLQETDNAHPDTCTWFWRLCVLYGLQQAEPTVFPAIPVRYLHHGDELTLRVFCNHEAELNITTEAGVPITPCADKRLAHRLGGKLLLMEHILRFPLGTAPVKLSCNGIPVYFVLRRRKNVQGCDIPSDNRTTPWFSEGREYLTTADGGLAKHLLTPPSDAALSLSPGLIRRKLGLHPSPQGGGWLFIDRKDVADDNAEHLYRYVAAQQPEFPIYFILSPQSRDWARLQKEGFHLLPYGSKEHYRAYCHCDTIVSSQIGAEPFFETGPYEKRYIFLQHGVIYNDLHRWLNTVTADFFLTTTPGEYESIGGAESFYKFGTGEMRLLGLPRHDRLLEMSRTGNRRILVVPTWREYLSRYTPADFAQSEYTTRWAAFLRHPYLKELHEQGYRILFALHPNMRRTPAFIEAFHLPAYIELPPEGCGYQELFAFSDIGITDYSSAVFDMALLGKTLLYYQFDAATFFTAHTLSPGYFRYERDAFGPVVTNEEELMAHLRDIIHADGKPAAEYARRMQQTFPFRDGKNCERTYQAIRKLR